MKKSLFVLPVLLLLFVVSCQKDEEVLDSFIATQEEVIDDDGSKSVFSNGAVQWETGDRIKVFGSAGSGVYQARVRSTGRVTYSRVSGNAGSAPYRAIYPASAANSDGTIKLPAVQATADGSLTDFPQYAEGSSTNFSFKYLCGILRMRLQKSDVSISSIEVTGDIELTGDHIIHYNSGAPTLEYSGNGTNTVTMTCSVAQDITNQKDFYIYLPVHVYGAGMQIKIYNSDGGVCTKTISAGNSISIQRGKIVTIALRNNSLEFVNPLPQGALSGLFTINESGDQVYFSQGNLQYGLHTGTWRFAEHQYDYVGNDTYGNVYENGEKCSNTYIFTSASFGLRSWIDLFGWGTGNNPTRYDDGWVNPYDDYSEWGNNAISNGGNQPNCWRTLTWLEWDYLTNWRTNAWFKHGIGTVNGVHGLILLPDSWTLPSGCTFNRGGSSWTHNEYTLAQWQAMEAAGALFLPASGSRDYDEDVISGYPNAAFSGVDQTGYYWTSTGQWAGNSVVYVFSESSLTGITCTRAYGMAVRLVKDVE